MVIGQAIVIGQTTVIRQAIVIRQAMAARLEPLDSSGMIVASACNRRAMPSYCFYVPRLSPMRLRLSPVWFCLQFAS